MRTESENVRLAEMLFPGDRFSVAEIEKRYPKRNLDKKQVVSRFAPSPTGYMHVGNFFQMFISYNLTRVTDGVFFLRIEDTDNKREKADAVRVIYENLARYGISFDEYQTLDGEDIGMYGPYVQSKRVDIYKAYAKKLVAEGKAFPCFCKKTEGKADVLKLREEKFKIDDGKEYDPCRDMPLAEIEEHLANGEKFAIRLRTQNDGTQRVKFYDLIKGEIEANANAKDIILLKNDGIPPYAFAHAIDDTLMGTTIVVRGEEYISSTPAHIEIFDALGFPHITYCHNPLICKIGDEGNRRKISKRYDPEADMRYYADHGYPVNSLLEYLLNLLNSKFEGWRNQNPMLDWKEFKFGIKDITAVAPILDLVKLTDVSKNVISRMTAEKVYNETLDWAREHDVEFANILDNDPEYSKAVLNIDREKPRPRKDIGKWEDVKELYFYMFNELFWHRVRDLEFPENISREDVHAVVLDYATNMHKFASNEEWFAFLKTVADRCGFASDMKAYKANPSDYKGSIADVSAIIRVCITTRKNSPDLFEIISLLGEDEVKKRLIDVIKG